MTDANITPVAAAPTLDYQSPQNTPNFNYTGTQLFKVFALMLLASFAFMAAERVMPSSIPYQLDRLGFPMKRMSLIMTLPLTLFGIFFAPLLGYLSDRTRTRWGRRMPYLFAALIPVVLLLILLGFTDQFDRLLAPARGARSVVVAACASVVLYQLFNEILINPFFWIIGDLIPPHLLGRYFACYRMVGIGSGFLAGLAITPYLERYTPYCYGAAAFILLLGFIPLCLFARERPLPLPQDVLCQAPWVLRLFHATGTYFKQCFSHPIYLFFYGYTILHRVSEVASFGLIFYYRRHLGLSQASIGTVMGIISLSAVATALPLGWLVDRIHPMRIVVISSLALIPITIAGFFMNGFLFFVLYFAIRAPFQQAMDAASGPLSYRLFPTNQYAQFTTAKDMLLATIVPIAAVAAAYFIDHFSRTSGPAGNAYAFLWQAGFQLPAFACLFFTYHLWKRHGGDNFSYEVERRQN